MSVHLQSPSVNPYLHRNPNEMRRSPTNLGLRSTSENVIFCRSMSHLTARAGLCCDVFVLFCCFINCELFPFTFSLNSIQFATPKLIMTSTAPAFVVTTLCLVPCLKGEKIPLGIYSLLISIFDRLKSEKCLVLFYSFPERITFIFPDQPLVAMEITPADQVICMLISVMTITFSLSTL